MVSISDEGIRKYMDTYIMPGIGPVNIGEVHKSTVTGEYYVMTAKGWEYMSNTRRDSLIDGATYNKPAEGGTIERSPIHVSGTLDIHTKDGWVSVGDVTDGIVLDLVKAEAARNLMEYVDTLHKPKRSRIILIEEDK